MSKKSTVHQSETDANLLQWFSTADLTDIDFVSLTQSDVTDDGLAPLAKAKALRRLFLNLTSTHDKGLAHLSGLIELEDLHLMFTKVTDKGLPQLSGLINLKWADLSCTQLTDEGLPNLANWINLLEVDLRGTKVTNRGMPHLACVPKLERVYLQEYNPHFKEGVTAAGLKLLPKHVEVVFGKECLPLSVLRSNTLTREQNQRPQIATYCP